MSLFSKFLQNKSGNIAIQFSILLFPLLSLAGVGIDYSRIAVTQSSLQSTLDQNVVSLQKKDFNNRKAMENFIVAMAGVNLRSDTIKADISLYRDVLRIVLSDTVNTPIMGLMGQSKVEVQAVVQIKQKAVPTRRENVGSNTVKSTSATTKSTKKKVDRSRVNDLKRQARASIKRVRSYKSLSPKQKRKLIDRLNQHLDYLNKL